MGGSFLGKQARLAKLASPSGIIGALAIDQRKSLRRMIAEAAHVPVDQIPDGQLIEFKRAISEVLSSHATAILFDTEYGMGGTATRAPGCGLLLAYEADGYENPRPNRALALMRNLSVQRIADMGADGVKILLHYSAADSAAANELKFAMIERIGAECSGVGLPFFLEPVLYDPSYALVQSGVPAEVRREQAFAFAQRKPELVVDMMREFSRDRYRVDILKVEFPVVSQFVEGSRTFAGTAAYTMEEAMRWYRAADEAAGKPYIYLSAGVSNAEFLESLRLAVEAKTRFSGVLCGRATWQDGVASFVAGGSEGFRGWLQSEGVANIEALNRAIASATPWHQAAAASQVA